MTPAVPTASLAPQDVHAALRRWMLADGFPFVLDLEKSRGARLHDARSGRAFLDFFGCFGSTPIGWNHPALLDAAWQKSAARALANRPSNSDLYSVEMAEFVERMAEVARPAGYQKMFFVDGGALAVENALKVAFDWKVRRNRAKGVDADVGQKVLHFRKAFHGRSGYTMSLTNTRPDKVLHFPKFESWPRCDAPEVRFPLAGEALAAHARAEQAAFEQVDAAFARHGDDVAAILIETIQCEGGDRHFRPEFLQGLQARAEKYDCLFLLDEVQTGFFTSGKAWAFEHYGVAPDVFAFGKKSQQCGIMAGPRVMEVPGNVFETPSRINSTWGGNLVDMVRATRILEVIRDEDLGANAAARGSEWLEGMRAIQARCGAVSNARGLGLLMAFDLPDGATRDRLLLLLREEGLLGLVCGERTLRFRPHLAITAAEVAEALDLTDRALKRL
jgi:L-lysine 6-transaminase